MVNIKRSSPRINDKITMDHMLAPIKRWLSFQS